MNKNKLTVLWTTDNIDTSLNMILMYTKNAMINKWFLEIEVIVWGASMKLVSENLKIQKAIKETELAGVKFKGCLACAKKLLVEDKINEFGLELDYMGVPLTNVLKSDGKLLTM